METNGVVVKKERPDAPPVFTPEPAGDFPSFETPASTLLLSQAYVPSIHSAMSMTIKEEMFMMSDSITMTFETDQGPLSKKQMISNSITEAEHLIGAIKAKHGNIDEYCIVKSERARKQNVALICDVVKELQEKTLEELEVDSLEHHYEVVRDMEKLNINVKWLLQRLDEIREAITSRDEAKGLANKKKDLTKKLEERRREVDEKMREVERLKAVIRVYEGQEEQLDNSIRNRTSNFGKFQNKPLMDGLI